MATQLFCPTILSQKSREFDFSGHSVGARVVEEIDSMRQKKEDQQERVKSLAEDKQLTMGELKLAN